MAAKKLTSKKKTTPRFFEQTDMALALAAVFATLSVVFTSIVIARYL